MKDNIKSPQQISYQVLDALFAFKVSNKTRMSTLRTSVQYCSGDFSKCSKTRQRGEKV